MLRDSLATRSVKVRSCDRTAKVQTLAYGRRVGTGPVVESAAGHSDYSALMERPCIGIEERRTRGSSAEVSGQVLVRSPPADGRLTMGTRPRDGGFLASVPFTTVFPVAWLGQALQRRSRSDFSNNTVVFAADSAAIRSNAFERMSRPMASEIGAQRRTAQKISHLEAREYTHNKRHRT